MEYWFCLVVSITFISFLSDTIKDVRFKCICSSLVILIYGSFAMFRFGIGQDYDGYISVINEIGRTYSFFEPGYTLIVKTVKNLELHHVYFFGFFGFLTAFLMNLVSKPLKNTVSYNVVYLCVPMLYFNSLNLVRQYFAAAIFLYATKYISSKKSITFTVLVLFASAFHFSALFLLPFYFLLSYNFQRKDYVLIVLLSYILGSVIILPLDFLILSLSDYYAANYSGETTSTNNNYFSLLLALVFLIIVCFSRQRLEGYNLVAMNMFLMLTVFYLFIPSFYYLYRFAIYFLVCLPLVITIFLSNGYLHLIQKALLLLFVFMFCNFLLEGIDNKKIVPEKFYPVLTIIE